MADLNIWDSDRPSHDGPRTGLYIAITGNTAAGKSSLISELQRRLTARGLPAVGISERVFHHQLLRLMFSEPSRFAFSIQLTFLLERHLVLLRNVVSLNRTVIVERSHFDDALFVREHADAGHISRQELNAYTELSGALHARIPVPDVLVLMNPTPETSILRLGIAESRGDRPREFPSEAAKEGWVRRWYDLYQDLHQRYRELGRVDPAWTATKILDVDPELDNATAVDTVEAEIVGRLAR